MSYISDEKISGVQEILFYVLKDSRSVYFARLCCRSGYLVFVSGDLGKASHYFEKASDLQERGWSITNSVQDNHRWNVQDFFDFLRSMPFRPESSIFYTSDSRLILNKVGRFIVLKSNAGKTKFEELEV